MSLNEKVIVTSLGTRQKFLDFLKVNPGIIIIKFGAEWCSPCQKIKGLIYQYYKNMPENIICCDIDADENYDVYTFLKAKRMVNGIPALLAYYSGNESYVPDDFVSGANEKYIADFFNRCLVESKK